MYTGIFNCAGYPGDLSGGLCMYFDSDYGRTATEYNHWYYMDTAAGQSGMPVWAYYTSGSDPPPGRYTATVHAYGDDGSGSNHGTRLNQDKFDRIPTWIDSDAPPTDKADLIDDGQAWSGFTPTTVERGVTTLQVWCDVRNVGTAASGGFYVSYYASTNTTISTSDYLIATDYVSSISPFDYADSDWTGAFPSSVPSGIYWVGWIIDSGSGVTEFDEGNNVAYKEGYQLTVEDPGTDLPDLYSPMFYWKSSSVNEGDPFWVRVEVANRGSASAGPSHVQAYLSIDDDWDVSDDYYLGKKAVGSLAPGASETPQWDFNMPDLSSGPYDVWIVAVIDCDGEVLESDESNPWKAGTFTASDGDPDIFIDPTALFLSEPAAAAPNRTQKEIGVVVPICIDGRPPDGWVPRAAALPEPNIQAGINVLSDVPAYDWCYGCSATSAAMIFGYYDRTGYSDMYSGPASGGVCPLNNELAWAAGESPLSASHLGIDGRSVFGHVDDYWVEYLHPGPDPFIGNWPEHSPRPDCTGDAMGTNQSLHSCSDGATYFWLNTFGDPLYDYVAPDPYIDGCHGMRLYAESRGYTVVENFSQYIRGQGTDPNKGFTFDDFVAEIDAGRPVMIQIQGHSMVGFGYNTSGSIVYIRNTWDHTQDTMTWGGTYSGMQHYAVSVIRLSPVSPENTFTIFNQGTGTLSVTSMDHVSYLSLSPMAPFDVGPGGGQPITVTVDWNQVTHAETTRILVYSNDPDESPYPDAVYVTVTPLPPTISRSPTSLSNSCVEGQNAPSQSFEVWNSGGGTLSYSITDNAAWLDCGPTSGTSTGEHDSIAVNYTTSGLSAGSYSATITVTDPDATNSPQTVPVSLTVIPVPPAISRQPDFLDNYCPRGHNAASQSFELWNSGGGTLSYTITDDADWLSCSPDLGTSTGEHDSITVNYSTSGLSAVGTYTATVTISAPGASNTPQTVDVSLTVLWPPVIALDPISLNNSCPRGTDAASQSFTIWNNGVWTLSYAITDDADWLSCSPTSGTCTSEQDTISVNYTSSGLAAGSYSATITVTDPLATNNPQTIPVSLTVESGMITWYVDASVPASGDGRSWETAFKTVQDGINAAWDGDDVIVAPGTYPPIDFLGKAITVHSTGPTDPSVVEATVIDAGGVPGSEEVRPVTFDHSESLDSVLSGFKITGGFVYSGGGGILCDGASPTIENSIVVGNDSCSPGGGICCIDSSALIRGNTITGNDTRWGESRGGGIHCSAGSPEILANTISNNYGEGGGGVYLSNSYANVIGNVIFGNESVPLQGGGICCYGAPRSIANNLIYANRAGSDGGGGIYCGSSHVLLTNNTIASNEAQWQSGGGVYGGTLLNCIVWGNIASEGTQLYGSAATYSCIEGGYPGEGNIPYYPYFVDSDAGDYHLQPVSPCIDAGDPAPDYSNEPEPNGGRIDMGAYGNTSEATSKAEDSDGDGLPDSWEEQIVDADPDDEITSIWDVLPGDDFDGDGTSNRIEYLYGLNPIVVNASPTTNEWYVDDDAPNDPGPGDPGVSDPLEDGSEEHPFDMVQEGINAAWHGDEVIVAEGTYQECINFLGKAIRVHSSDPTNRSVVQNTVIDGLSMGRVITFNSDEGPDSVLCGFTITGGWVTSEGGGGILCDGASPTIANNIITRNWVTSGNGAGICCIASSAVISDNVITCNRCFGNQDKGGGIYCSGGSPEISRNTVSFNSAASHGGGICLYDSAALVMNNTVFGNGADSSGGGIYCSGSGASIISNTIANNQAWESGGGVHGGTVSNCIVWGNTAWQSPQVFEATVTYSCIEGGYAGQGNLPYHPYFVDTDADNYHLLSWSPCIDAGGPASDYSNEPEPNGGRINIGADGNTADATSKSYSDEDGDGLPDSWEQQIVDADPDDPINSVWDVAPGDDFDGDGVSNQDEFLYGSDPTEQPPADYTLSDDRLVAFDETFVSPVFQAVLASKENVEGVGVQYDVELGGFGEVNVRVGAPPAQPDLTAYGNYVLTIINTSPDDFFTVNLYIHSGEEMTMNVSRIVTLMPGASVNLSVNLGSVPNPNDVREIGFAVKAYIGQGFGLADAIRLKVEEKVTGGAGSMSVQDETRLQCADSDGDSMPDMWEIEQGLNSLLDDAGLDLDQDGQSNLAEFFAGTAVNDPASVFRVFPDSVTADSLALTWTSSPGRLYRIWHSDDMFSWSPVTHHIPADSGETTSWQIHLLPAQSRGYYVIEVIR
jgi:hypothetical protein